MLRSISLYLFLVVTIGIFLTHAITITEHTPQTHPCDFYLKDADGACTVPYKFVDKTQEQNARYEVTIKAKEGNQTYWITDDSQGVKLKLNNNPGFAIDTAFFVPQRWRDPPGTCGDMSVSGTNLAYGLFADYVEVNRTSSIQGQYTGTMVETWRIGFDGKQYLKKLPLLSQAMKLAGEMSDMD